MICKNVTEKVQVLAIYMIHDRKPLVSYMLLFALTFTAHLLNTVL